MSLLFHTEQVQILPLPKRNNACPRIKYRVRVHRRNGALLDENQRPEAWPEVRVTAWKDRRFVFGDIPTGTDDRQAKTGDVGIDQRVFPAIRGANGIYRHDNVMPMGR